MNSKALTILLLLVLTGCSIKAPQPVEPGITMPARYHNDTQEVPGSPTVVPWWLQFEDPFLDRMMTQLFAGNLALEQGLARLQRARAAFVAARAGLFPAASLDGEATRSRTAGGFTGDTYRGSLTVGYELDLWEKFAAQSEAAALTASASTGNLEALYLSLSAQLADLYFLAVEQRAQQKLTDESIAAFRDTLERVERRYRAGLVEAVDVYQARQNLLAAETRRPAIEANLKAAEHAIDILLGDYPGQDRFGRVDTLPREPARLPAGLPADLLTRRPDVRAALARVRAADAEIAAALAERLPAVNLLGALGHAGTETLAGPVSGNVWSLVAGLAMPVLDGGRRRAEVERREAAFDENLAAYRQTILVALREVEDSLVANRTTAEQIALQAEQTTAAEGSLRLALDRYLQGVTDYLPVLVAQARQLESRSELIRLRRQLVAARISLAKALGGEWMQDYSSRRVLAGRDASNE